MTTYSDKLQHPLWKQKRLEILGRDNFTCRSCGDGYNTLHVHHKYYIRGLEPWEYSDRMLMTLCDACHKLHHEIQKLNSKDFPPLFLPPFKSQPTISEEKDFMRQDYFLTPTTDKRIPAKIIRQFKFVIKIIELADIDKETSYETVTGLAKAKLDEMCTRCNVNLITSIGFFGNGDVTDLKPEQYF